MSWVLVCDHANDDPRLNDVGPLAAWYHFAGAHAACRRLEPVRRGASQRLDVVPKATAFGLLANYTTTQARAAVKALQRVGLWTEANEAFVLTDYMQRYYPKGDGPTVQPRPAEPIRLDQPTPSRLGGIARAVTASRGPAGRFQPRPADHQPAGPAGPAPRASDPDPDPDQISLNQPTTQGPDRLSRAEPDVVVGGDEAEKIPCPSGLVLLDGQRGTLVTSLVPEWAIDELEQRFRANYTADPTDRRTLVVWRKCLGSYISRVWNNPAQRPPAPGVAENESQTRLRLARGPRQPNTMDHLDDEAHAKAIGARLE